MKKLLVLMLVLGMVSAANATLSIAGPPEINEGDTVSIGINNTSIVYYDLVYLSFGYVSEGGFELSNPRLIYWPPPPGGLPSPSDPIDDVIWYGLSLHPPAPTPGVQPGIWFTMDLTCMSAGVDVFVELWDDALGYETPVDTLVIHQVPEPMTLALLGLSGLFVLRRRK